jgi:pyruvate decarboxylase
VSELIPLQYASYPTTDIRHILPRLLPAFKAVGSKRNSKPAEGESFSAKQDTGVVDTLEKGAGAEGKEIKHAWMWPRFGQWFAGTGQSSRE